MEENKRMWKTERGREKKSAATLRICFTWLKTACKSCTVYCIRTQFSLWMSILSAALAGYLFYRGGGGAPPTASLRLLDTRLGSTFQFSFLPEMFVSQQLQDGALHDRLQSALTSSYLEWGAALG